MISLSERDISSSENIFTVDIRVGKNWIWKKIPRGFYLYVRINPLWNTETKEDHTINCFTLNIFLVVTCKREYWCSAKYSVESPSPSPSISSILETIHLQYYTLQLHIIHKHRIRSKLHPNINWLYTIAMYSQQFL